MKRKADVGKDLIDVATEELVGEGYQEENFPDRDRCVFLASMALNEYWDTMVDRMKDLLIMNMEAVPDIERARREQEEKAKEEEELRSRDREQRTSTLEFNWS